MAEKREPNAVIVTPAGDEIVHYDSTGVDGRPQMRRYVVNGKRFLNVTTVLGVLAKEALLHWVARETAAGRDWRETRDDAARRGTQTHALIARILAGEKASLADIDPEQRAWGQAAYRWLRDAEPDVYLSETMVCWPLHGYAGRLDLVATIDGRLTLCDFKTTSAWAYKKSKGKPTDKKLPPYDENLLQLDLYAGALIASGYELPDRGLIVRLGPDGSYDETFCELDPDRGLAILAAHRAKRAAGRALREARKVETSGVGWPE